MATDAEVTIAVSSTVFLSRVSVRARQSSSQSSVPP
jgi:hypothetical protein